MELNTKTIKKILLIVTFSVLLFWAVHNMEKVALFAAWAFRILTPFILGLCIAFILNVLLCGVEKYWTLLFERGGGRKSGHTERISDRIRRPVCLIVTLCIVAGFIFVLLVMVVPEVRRTILAIVDAMPGYIRQLEIWWGQLVEKLQLSSDSMPKWNLDQNKLMEWVTKFVTEGGRTFVNTTVSVTTSIFVTIFNFVLGLVFSIYVLLQKEKLCRQFKKLMFAYMPPQRVERVLHVTAVSNRIFSKFVTGQLTEALIIGILCFIGMNLFSMPYAMMISCLVGVTALIPVFGAFIGTGIGAFLILMVDPIKALWFVIFIIVLQQFEGNLIYPKVVGKSVGLPGIWVLVAVTIGGSAAGVMGMLLSVPICSVVYCLLQQSVSARLRTRSVSERR